MDELEFTDKRCRNCEHFWQGKTDDGRFYICNNQKLYDLFKSDNVLPDFGCIYFKTEEGNN